MDPITAAILAVLPALAGDMIKSGVRGTEGGDPPQVGRERPD